MVKTMLDRRAIRQTVYDELRRSYQYREALKHPAEISPKELKRMRAWIAVADELIETLQREPDGKARAAYASDVFSLSGKRQSMRYVNARSSIKFHMSEDGLRKWKDQAVFTASILAVLYGAVDLSGKG